MLRTIIFLTCVLLELCGCSNMARMTFEDPYERDLDSRQQEILLWVNSEKPKVEEGTLKNSEYYRTLQIKVLQLRPDLTHYLLFAEEMGKVSELYEEGVISKQELEKRDVELTSILSRDDNRRDAILSQLPSVYEAYEIAQFTLYRDSLFTQYLSDLQTRLNKAGPQYPVTRCDVFGDRILCVTK